MFAEIDTQLLVNITARVLHTVFGSLLLGGLLYQRLALVGSGVDAGDESLRRTWSKWVGIASGFLLLSGLYNTWLFLLSGQYEKIHHVYHMLWGAKFLLALALMVLAALLAGKTNRAKAMQVRRNYWLNIAIVLAVSIFVLGAVMRTYDKVKKGTVPAVAVTAPGENSVPADDAVAE